MHALVSRTGTFAHLLGVDTQHERRLANLHLPPLVVALLASRRLVELLLDLRVGRLQALGFQNPVSTGCRALCGLTRLALDERRHSLQRVLYGLRKRVWFA